MPANPQLERLPCVIAAREAASRAGCLEELAAEILAYRDHPIAAETRAVPGRRGANSPEAPLMLLGKSPAATETERGIPFQGPAAQILRQAIAAAGFDIEDCHQTHATYWRPRKENTPNATQIAFSRPFIEREIEIVRPRRIVALGAKALDSLFHDHPPISEAAGSETVWRGIPVTVVRNHGYIMRFPKETDAFVSALARAAA